MRGCAIVDHRRAKPLYEFWRETSVIHVKNSMILYRLKMSEANRSTVVDPTSDSSLYVSIDADAPNGAAFSRYSSSGEVVLFTLAIPNRLLQDWYRNPRPFPYTELVNSKIRGKVCSLKACSRLNECLRVQAHNVARKAGQAGGRKRKQILDSTYHLYVLKNECENFDDIKKEAVHFKEMATKSDGELKKVLEEMAHTIATYEDELEHAIVPMTENKGKTVEEVSPRQARRKLKQVTSLAEQALWFAESFGLVPQYVMLHKSGSRSPVKIDFGSSMSVKENVPQASDYNKLHQVLYILDRFAVSDEAYHELSVISDLPHLHKVKNLRVTLNNKLDLRRLPEPHLGAYRPFETTLQNEIAKAKENTPNLVIPGSTIKVKLSGDGARLSKASNIVLFSFSLPDLQSNVLSGAGNHTIAAIKTDESYETIGSGMGEVLEELNALIARKNIMVDNQSYQLEFFLGSDYKFLLMILGLNKASSNYACVWCHIHKDERWDMAVSSSVYTTNKVRTLDSIKKCAALPKSRPAKERLGVLHNPIISIDIDHVIADELHLFLRIGDVLIRNLIFEMVAAGRRDKQANLRNLEGRVRECGVGFNVWEVRDASGKPSGKYDWTSLKGDDMKKLVKKLPSKFSLLLRPDLQHTMECIWKDFFTLYLHISSLNPPSSETIQSMAKSWINLFLSLQDKCEGFQKRNVTPYMHCLVYHVPQMIKLYGNIKLFSGQGVEKNNDDAKRNYFSSNLQDVTGEILKAEWRLENTEKYKRKKRPYQKRDNDYWENGGIQEKRIRSN